MLRNGRNAAGRKPSTKCPTEKGRKKQMKKRSPLKPPFHASKLTADTAVTRVTRELKPDTLRGQEARQQSQVKSIREPKLILPEQQHVLKFKKEEKIRTTIREESAQKSE